MSAPNFQLSKDIEHYLAVLSKLYAKERERQKLEIIVNSQIRVHEEWTNDDWGEGKTYGHALYITVPETLYLKSVRKRKGLQSEIAADINKIHNVANEFIAEVFLDSEKVEDRDWRRESGALQSRQRTVLTETSQRIWGADGYRVFLGHKTEVKKKAAEPKEQLKLFGISAFVAHADIQPTKEWQEEIESALASMDSFVALLTEKFHNSPWTDQEVGYAISRGVPMIAVKLGRDPYGFIGRFQALSCTWDDAALAIVKLLIKQPRVLDSYIAAASRCTSFDNGNTISQLLPYIKDLSSKQTEQLMLAFNNNSQLRSSFGFDGTRPSFYGDGLAKHLTRITGGRYVIGSTGEIKRKDR